LLFVFELTSCVNTKHLKEGEYLLYQQKIKGNKHVSSSELEVFFRQRPNRKILRLPIMPYLSANYIGKKEKYEKKGKRKKEKIDLWYHKKSKKKPGKQDKWDKKLIKKVNKANLLENEGPSIKRSFGEPPAIYDDRLAKETSEQISEYLKKKGYFENEVIIETNFKKKRVSLIFRTMENDPTLIRQIISEFSDTTMRTILSENQVKKPKLKPGSNYDEFLLKDEIDRIEKTLRNSGYFRFRKQYVRVTINDTIVKRMVDITIKVAPPKESNASRRFKINGVSFIEDASLEFENAVRDTSRYNGVRYIHFKPYIKLKQLNQKVRLFPNQYYSQENTLRTQRNLANLNTYKYSNIRFDSARDGFQAYIYTSPLPKYTTSFEVGAAVTQWLPGPFGSLSFRARNIFGGAEMLDISLKGKIEAQTSFASETNFYQSADLGITAAFTFPNIAIPTAFRFRFKDQNPKTSLVAGYIYSSRPEYARHNGNMHLRYGFAPKLNTSWSFNFFDFTVVRTDVRDPRFSLYLIDLKQNGNNLINSFGNSVVTSMSTEFVYNDFRINQNKKSKYYNIYFESGGTIWNFVEGRTSEPTDTVLGLQYYKFFKGSFDFRKYFPTTRKSLGAFRFTSGLSYPYGTNESLPYEKYYFVGGSNTMRAWKPRRLGPGSFSVKDQNGQITYQFEQPGEILLLANLEWRFGIYRFIKGALFADVGNIWRIFPNNAQPGAEFSLNRFYKEIAVGIGYGFRFDFSFIVLRIDAGIKIYDPALPEGSRLVAGNLENYDPLNQQSTLWNISIGYPF
jgi:outer membrane protein insertion porin family